MNYNMNAHIDDVEKFVLIFSSHMYHTLKQCTIVGAFIYTRTQIRSNIHTRFLIENSVQLYSIIDDSSLKNER